MGKSKGSRSPGRVHEIEVSKSKLRPPAVVPPGHHGHHQHYEVPFAAICLWDYAGQSERELSFARGENLVIVSVQHDEWWEARNASGKKGFVPRNHIKKAPKGPAPPVSPPPAFSFTQSFSTPNIEYVLVTVVDPESIVNDGLAYEVLVGLGGGKLRAKHKRWSDFRALATELITRVYPKVAVPPRLAEKTQELLVNSFEEASLLSGDGLGDYLQELVEQPKMSFLLNAWLFPGEGLTVDLLFPLLSPETSPTHSSGERERGRDETSLLGGGGGGGGGEILAGAHHRRIGSGEPGQEYLVMYRWEGVEGDDLDLNPGDTILVLQSHVDGWWYGRSVLTSEVGYFPRNFVQRMDETPQPPPRRASTASQGGGSQPQQEEKAPPLSPRERPALHLPPPVESPSASSKGGGTSVFRSKSRSRSPSPPVSRDGTRPASPDVSPINKLAKAVRNTIKSWGHDEEEERAAEGERIAAARGLAEGIEALGGKVYSPHYTPPVSPIRLSAASRKEKEAAGGLGSPGSPRRIEVNFALKTLEAFDELMDRGVAVEMYERDQFEPMPAPQKGQCAPGCRVTVACSAYTWDGASNKMRQYATTAGGDGKMGENLDFVMGTQAVPSGLDKGLQRLSPGHQAFIIATPREAYGEAGMPPLVPKNSHIVWKVEILACSEGPLEGKVTPRGPSLLLEEPVGHRKTASGIYIGSARSTPVRFFASDNKEEGGEEPRSGAGSRIMSGASTARPKAEDMDTDALMRQFAQWNSQLGKGPEPTAQNPALPTSSPPRHVTMGSANASDDSGRFATTVPNPMFEHSHARSLDGPAGPSSDMDLKNSPPRRMWRGIKKKLSSLPTSPRAGS